MTADQPPPNLPEAPKAAPVTTGPQPRPSKFRSLVTVLSATALALWLVRTYIAIEAPYYWSDFNYYEWATRISLNAMVDSPITFPLLLVSSATLTHNLFFTAPLAPLMVVLGDNRTGFIESVALAYFIPFATLLASFGGRLLQPAVGSKKWLFFIFTFTCLAIPPLWAPLLRGYPDYSAALALLWCAHLYFKNRDLTSEKYNYYLGFFLALAVLLRRYFAYDAIAFVLALIIDQWLAVKTLPALKAKFIPLLQIGMAGSVTIIALGFSFLVNVTRHNYHALYESYHVSLMQNLTYFGSSYGLVILLASLAGMILAWRTHLWQKENLRFALTFYGAGCLFWLLGPNELGTHYTLYFTPLVAFGLFGLIAVLRSPINLARAAVAIALCLFAVFNLALSLMPPAAGQKLGIGQFAPGMLSFVEIEGEPLGALFSANYGPWQRSDRGSLHGLVTDMRAVIAAEQEPSLPARMNQAKQVDKRGLVYVAAFSNTLSDGVLRNAERELYGKYGDTIAWAELPCVDSKDSYALERLLGASYVVVSDKPQYFIQAQEQDILTSILTCFKEGWPLAQDFAESDSIAPQTLDGGVKATVYKRLRPTALKEAALTLGKMRQFVKDRPGSQPAWITTGSLSEICYDLKRPNFSFKLDAPREKCLEGERRYLLYSDQLPDSFVLEGDVIKAGVPIPLAVECVQLDQEGHQVVSQQFVLKDDKTHLKLELARGRTAYLALVLDKSADGESGTVSFDKLTVKAIK